MVTALNHDEVDPAPESGAARPPQLRWERTDPHTWALSLASAVRRPEGPEPARHPARRRACEVTAGALLEAQASPVFLRNIAAHGLDAGVAAMGPGAAIEGAGELLRVVTSGPLPALPVEVLARDQQNNELLADGEITAATIPAAHHLDQNSPNPFNPRTTIRFALPRAGHVHLTIYSLDGRRVRTLIDGERAAGQHAVTWEGRDDAGRAVATGTYFYSLRAGEHRQVRKMTLLK